MNSNWACVVRCCFFYFVGAWGVRGLIGWPGLDGRLYHVNPPLQARHWRHHLLVVVVECLQAWSMQCLLRPGTSPVSVLTGEVGWREPRTTSTTHHTHTRTHTPTRKANISSPTRQRLPAWGPLLWVLLLLLPGVAAGRSTRRHPTAFVHRPSSSVRSRHGHTTTRMNSAPSATSPETVPERRWDAAQGVWVGAKALADDDVEIPSPLWILGYGSLMFRPEESFAGCARVEGVVEGWRRMWAQRSCDHRGEPHMPGLVVTVLSDAELEALGLRQPGDPPSRVHGVAYRIPDEQVAHVLQELDFREKGGYTRAVVEVLPAEGGPAIKALLYTGNAENPNFHQPTTLEEAAHIVAWSKGPSGENKEYLFEVDAYLQRVGAVCEETTALTASVRQVLERGLDRRASLDARHQALEKPVWQRVGLQTWGSNQYGQLGSLTEEDVDDDGEWARPRPTFVEVNVAGTVSLSGVEAVEEVTDEKFRVRQLVAGGGHSALVTEEDRLYLWGWNQAGQVGGSTHVVVEGTHHAQVFPRRVAMVALGHAHTLVLEKDTGRVYGLGSNAAGEATGQTLDQQVNSRGVGGGVVTIGAGHTELRMRWCAAGVRHSAGVTKEEGKLVTWGSRKHGEGLPASLSAWAPADGARVAKVWCGWQHTVVLDDRGRVWTLGANKYGQLGRDLSAGDEGLPQLVSWPADAGEVEVVDLACGWSHVLAQAKDGQVWGWGRNTFGQLGKETETVANPEPFPLLPASRCLPNGAMVARVACGTESSLLVGADGSVWACGWNEHGNLGVGDTKDHFAWTQVPGIEGGGESLLVACGGAHVVVLTQEAIAGTK